MKYCTKCLMPDTRPGIEFDENGVCHPCLNYEQQNHIDWEKRKSELDVLCEQYRGKNGSGPDCAIAVSGGKDSHFQVYFMKEVMKMNPLLLSVGNLEWTETGRKNLTNIADTFNCDMLIHQPNPNVARRLTKAAFEQFGSPTWYWDALGYAAPWRMAIDKKLPLLIYGENVSHTYGGNQAQETPSARHQSENNVVKPIYQAMLKHVSDIELHSAMMVTPEESDRVGMDAIYLSYFTGWDSHRNYEIAKLYGFQHLSHEHEREGTIEQYNQIDTLSYLVNQYMKYPKYGHASATEMASRWIRAGYKTRAEMIPLVEEKDGVMDQRIAELFMQFINITPKEFYDIIGSWYNTDLFFRDRWGIWRPKFKVGKGLLHDWQINSQKDAFYMPVNRLKR